MIYNKLSSHFLFQSQLLKLPPHLRWKMVKTLTVLFFSIFLSCQTEEDLEVPNAIAETYKSDILHYLSSIPTNQQEGTLFTGNALKNTIDYQSIAAIKLNDIQTLLIANLGNVTNNDKAKTTKIVFYLQKKRITNAKIVTFENAFSDYNSTIKYMLNNENEAITYSGKVTIHSVEGRFEFSGDLDQGRLKAHSRAFRKKDLTNKSDKYCTYWYKVDSINGQVVAITFLFKTCETDTQDGSGHGDGTSTGDWAIFPATPIDKQKLTHIEPSGIITIYQYKANGDRWDIINVTIPENAVIIYTPHSQLQSVPMPQHQQVVVGSQFIYQYNSYAGAWVGQPKEIIIDTCAGIKKLISSIAVDTEFTTAVSSIKAAVSADGFEHSITLGKDSNGKITQAPMNNGTSQYLVKTNTTWAGAFAAIHNHPNGTPMSAGDIYAAVKLNTLRPDFTTTFLVLPDGSMYALVVTDLEAAKAFVTKYPADQLPGYSPEFPTFIFDELQRLVSYMGSTVEGKTEAIAFVLDQNNSGMKLLKQDANGDFNPIQTEETIQGGTKIYTPKPCN